MLLALKQEEARQLTALEDEQSRLEVCPKDAILVDVRHYTKKQKIKTDTNEAHLLELGKFWLFVPH